MAEPERLKDIEYMTVNEIKAELKERGAALHGRKGELVDR